ncbi:MAG: cation:proton antiporter subunit C [Bacteroidales bacterium]|nr:cation:proton antiporter subunit C [Bacteroidales bacterium]
MTEELMQQILKISFYGASLALILIGLYGVLTKKNLIKILLSMAIAESGLNLLFVAIGYIMNGTAPIFSTAVLDENNQLLETVTMVDPIPQALVLTAIVIGLGVTAVGLALVIRLYKHHNTINIDEIRNLKW